MIMKCTSCGITYDSAYGHYNCVPALAELTKEVLVPTVPAERRSILPVDVIEAWGLTYNLGVAIDKIGCFAQDGDLQYLEDAIKSVRREISRVHLERIR